MSRRTQDTLKRSIHFAYRSITFYGYPFQNILLYIDFVTPYRVSYNPSPKTGLGCYRFARHYSGNRFFFLFLQVLRCFSSLGYSLISYEFTYGYMPIKTCGFPHSDIAGSKRTSSSPMHIVGSHVLHRLLLPRHPPFALINLTTKIYPNLMSFEILIFNI